jgi:dTDP-4-amino-4,6-dideoxygalactose transaminase
MITHLFGNHGPKFNQIIQNNRKIMSFEIISEFEKSIAKFFGSPYAVAVDSCTHGVELCLRLMNISKILIKQDMKPA